MLKAKAIDVSTPQFNHVEVLVEITDDNDTYQRSYAFTSVDELTPDNLKARVRLEAERMENLRIRALEMKNQITQIPDLIQWANT